MPDTRQKTLWPGESNERIRAALQRLFSKHRIVFWYDAERELRHEFESLELPGVEKVPVANNEFALKYRMLREQPEAKFLLYKEGPQPPDAENWLLDVQLAHDIFRTDQAAIWLAELELGYEFADVVQGHMEFYSVRKRREALKRLASADDTPGRVRLKMLAVCAGADPRLDSVLEHLLDELAAQQQDQIGLVQRADLTPFLWEQVEKVYGYQSEQPGLYDFAIALFKSCYAMGTDGEPHLNSESLVFLKRWKDSRQHEAAFETLSGDCAQVLSIAGDLEQRDYRQVVELDYFELIDRKVLSELVRQVLGRTITAAQCQQTIRQRRSSHWFAGYRDMYEAVEHGALFLEALDRANLDVESLSQGVGAYVESLFRVDQLYRKFIFHFRRSRQVTLLEPLADDIRRRYTNSFLRPLGDHWQEKVDRLGTWQIPELTSQERFFERWVGRFLDKKRKVCVIVADALRYEVADELASVIRREDRYEADLKPLIACLPCYTQLGMAALLPHRTLQINDNRSATVNVDGVDSSGLQARTAILNAGAGRGRAVAIKAEELLSRTRDECRELTRDHDVIYVYQNRIDKVGHSRETERDAFAAVEETIDELVKVVKKLTAANASNILITADHGFLYQDEVEESDFSLAEPSGAQIVASDRRFVLGRDLPEPEGLKKFTADQLGLAGDLEVLIPKSINRFRKSGAAVRFMHGGCTLQEIVVPVIEISKRRTSDVTQVDVDVLPGSSSVISSGQLAVALYQTGPVTDKVHARKLRLGLYSSTGELLSDLHELDFDFASENPRERELKVRLVLSKQADAYNKQQVVLRLDEPVLVTSHHREYKSVVYTLRRSFTSDFDFD